MSPLQLVRGIVRWLLLGSALLFLVTGLGITEFGIVETGTFGLLTRNIAHRIHTAPALWISFLVLLALHICLHYVFKQKKPANASLN
jgi:hypothetical protein